MKSVTPDEAAAILTAFEDIDMILANWNTPQHKGIKVHVRNLRDKLQLAAEIVEQSVEQPELFA